MTQTPTTATGDKRAAIDGCKNCCHRFTIFVEKFSELIFVTSMLAATGFKIFWTIMSTDSGDFLQKVAYLSTCIHYVIFSIILFMSMRGNEQVKYYFGFLDGQVSKCVFLLFCANLVWPINVIDLDDNGVSGIVYFLKALSVCLIAVAILQLVRICTGNKEDSNKRTPMMEDESDMHMSID